MTTSDGGGDGLDVFLAERPRMFAIAYRMLGSATDAEDVLQDAWLRWSRVDASAIENSGAYLARVVTNLCLNALESARAKREVYPGPWMPEPVVTASMEPVGSAAPLGPLDDAAQRDTVSFALLNVLERLTPPERAAYVLREAFGYSHREVADLVGTSEANARQLHARARRHVATAKTAPVAPERWRQLVDRFLAAARDGDLAGLEALLARDVVSHADGGGIVNAARRPVFGRDRVARYLLGVIERFGAGLDAVVAEVNGELAVLAVGNGGLGAVWFVRTDGEEITRLDMVVNPQKLAFAQNQLSRNAGLPGL